MRQGLQLLIAALLVLVAGYVGYQWVFAEADAQAVRVLEASGSVSLATSGGAQQRLEVGDSVAVRQTVTVGPASRAVLGVGDGTRIELSAASAVRVVDADATGLRVELEHGRVSAHVRAGSVPVGVTSRGRAIYGSDADFSVAVDSDGALGVAAERGRLRVDGFGDTLTQVAAGQQLVSLPGEQALLEDVPVELLLDVGWPGQESTRSQTLWVEGRTQPLASLRVGHEGAWTLVRADRQGHFRAEVTLAEGANAVVVEARDALGNVTNEEHTITRDSTAPAINGSQVQWGP